MYKQCVTIDSSVLTFFPAFLNDSFAAYWTLLKAGVSVFIW